MKPEIKTYSIQAVYGGCTKCDGELINQDGSFCLSPTHDETIFCQDCTTEHEFPIDLYEVKGPNHPAF